MIDLRQYRANSARRFGSANHYHVGWVIGEDNRLMPILLTDDGIREARDRAIVNREDVPAIHWLHRFIAWLWEFT